MRVLVTGGAGFIGSYVCVELRRAGFDVVAVDSLERATGLGRLGAEGVPLLQLDLRDAEPPEADAVVHAAAYIDVAESWERPYEYFVNNAAVTAKLAKLAARWGAYFVYVSSAAVYGEPQYLPIDEEHPTRPVSPYGASKLAGELAVAAYAREGLRAAVVRPFNVYGPGQTGPYAGVVARFVERAARGEPPVIFGDGLQTRDFVHVRDVARLIRLLVERQAEGVYNAGSGRGVSVLELARLVMELAGVGGEPLFAPPRRGDVRHSVASIARARGLGWRPEVSLEEGLRELLSEAKKGKG